MKIKQKIYIALAFGILTACQDDELTSPTYTVGEAINAITLSAGISEGVTGVQTRAGENIYVPFSAQTQLRLRIDGTWTGHDPVAVSQMTTGLTAQSASEKIDGDVNDKHAVEFTTTEKLFWDDYGTADPANATTGRTEGLTIYGVAVEGKSNLPTTPTDLTSETLSWTNLTWNVGTVSESKINQKSGWSDYDIITSNNITSETGADGKYKFDDYVHDLTGTPKQSSNLLEFTHAMTKITVNLTAGEGFPGYATDPETAKFEVAPEVTLLSFNYMGKVNVEAKTSTPTATDGTTETPATTNIEAWRDNGNAWPTGGQHTSQFTALVFPGNQFTATIADDAPKYTPTSTTDILKLNADGNIYMVTAAQLVKAIAGTSTTGSVNGTLVQGKNYILNITVNKTKIEVTATIKAWEEVNTEEALPKINVTSTYGYTTSDGVDYVSAFADKDYDLFRSTTKATGYDEDNSADGINPAARYNYSSIPKWNKAIYWPNHQTHYFFRGVYPQVGTSVSGTSAVGAEAVITVSSNDVIAVANATYTTATYPSDLAIAMPRKKEGGYDETCKVDAHKDGSSNFPAGICATEGVINLNFEYAMSKVEVRLKSTATTPGNIEMTKDNTKVEIIGGYNKARIKLSDGLHDAYADADKGDYSLSNLETPVTDFRVTSRDAIVPQVIGNDVIFRITVTTGDNNTPSDPSDDPTDVYECKVNTINVKDTATPVTEWVHGKHYIYELDVNKTEIKVSATIKNWVTVEASENVWF